MQKIHKQLLRKARTAARKWNLWYRKPWPQGVQQTRRKAEFGHEAIHEVLDAAVLALQQGQELSQVYLEQLGTSLHKWSQNGDMSINHLSIIVFFSHMDFVVSQI